MIPVRCPDVRWRDAKGTRWRLRQQRLAWRRRIKPEAALDLAPGGGGDDPITFLLSIPFFVVMAVMLPLWLGELVLRLVGAPVAGVLRLAGVLPHRLELRRRGVPRAEYTARGRDELVRLRAQLRARHA
jgi:hypothetical protein